jgi:endonuclease/exonuclease/phosphatase family metal-dependent hydrolase
MTAIPLRVMTYNVRRCTGLVGRVRPEPIAPINARCAPDVVALQEVDVGRKRTGRVDQPARLGELTGMRPLFFPRIDRDGERYGIAVLSKHPVEQIKAERLPPRLESPSIEGVGALWVRVSIGGRSLQLIATHFNHDHAERMAQIEALIGPDWLQDPRLKDGAVLCGDLNTTRHSPIYARVRATMDDVQQRIQKYRKTWPSVYPIARIDHIFVTKSIGVRDIDVPESFDVRLASDHLPLIADLSI